MFEPAAEELGGERSRKSVVRKEPVLEESLPVARLWGQRLGTAVWIAFREACSPGFAWLEGGFT